VKVMRTESRLFPDTMPLDRLGVAGASLCAMHCVLMPLVFAALPFVGVEVVLGRGMEWGFLTSGLALGSLSFVPSFRRVHQRLLPFVLFMAGMALWVGARVGLGSDSAFEIPLVLTGAASVVAAHVINRRLCASCRSCEGHITGLDASSSVSSRLATGGDPVEAPRRAQCMESVGDAIS
jgi:hypothetical protein